MQGIETEKPYGFDQGAITAPLDIKTMMKFYAKNCAHSGGGNVMWVSPATPTPELHLSISKRISLKPKHPEPLILTIGLDKDTTQKEFEGYVAERSLKLASPPEKFHGWLMGFADACRGGDRDVAQKWVVYACSTQLQFVHGTPDDFNNLSMQKREALADEFDALRCTTLMRVLHFGAFKTKYEVANGTTGVQTLAKEYVKKVDLSERSKRLDNVTPSWIDQACTFLNRVWTIKSAQDVIIRLDDLPAGSNPLEGISKMQALISKAKTADKIVLCLEVIADMHQCGYINSSPPLSAFNGTQPGSHGKGIIDVMIAKWNVKDHLLNDWVGHNLKMKPDLIMKIKDVFENPKTYRSKCGFQGLSMFKTSFQYIYIYVYIYLNGFRSCRRPHRFNA